MRSWKRRLLQAAIILMWHAGVVHASTFVQVSAQAFGKFTPSFLPNEQQLDIDSPNGFAAAAYASLPRGQVGAFAVGGVAGSGETGRALALFGDQVTLLHAPPTPITSEMVVHLHGSLVPDSTGTRFGTATAELFLTVNGNVLVHYTLTDSAPPFRGACIDCDGVAGRMREIGLSVDRDFVVPLALTPQNSVSIGVQIVATAQGDARVDQSRTATVSLRLPEGVSFTSASGVFLTQAPIPEAQTWAMMLAGLAVLGWARRR